MPYNIKTSIPSINGNLDYLFITKKSQTKDAEPTFRITAALPGNRYEQIGIKFPTDPLPQLTDEQIEKSCRALKPILIKVPNAEVTLYHSNNGIGMTATATTAQIVTPKTNE